MPEILFICTGNICRSPMAAGLLAQELHHRGKTMSIASAGVEDLGGRRAHKDAVRIMKKMDVDISQHQSRYATTEILESSDIILGMTNEHVREVILDRPELFVRTFTLGEFVRRAIHVSLDWDNGLRNWAQTVNGNRVPGDLRGSSEEDVDDPLNKGRRHFKLTAHKLRDLTADLAGILTYESSAEE